MRPAYMNEVEHAKCDADIAKFLAAGGDPTNPDGSRSRKRI